MTPHLRRFLAAVLAFLILTTGCSAPGSGSSSSSEILAEPAYPEMAPYPNESEYINSTTGVFDSEGFEEVYDAWREDQLRQQEQPVGYTEGLSDFFAAAVPLLLTSGPKNTVCSPLNIYMALSLLAQTTGSASRQQILDAVGADSMDALRTQAGQVWNAHYCADSATTSVLANSLWLDSDLDYDAETIHILAEDFYTSVFRGDLGSDEMNQILQAWLNEQTGGLLEEQSQNVTMDPQTVLALASTIYYRAKWRSEFIAEQNTDGSFHTPDGDVDVTFMNKQLPYGPYYWGEDFAAAHLTLEDGSKFWMILPDEGKTPADLLESGLALDLVLTGSSDYENQKSLKVNLSLPKFDICADTGIKDDLQQLGITDVFSPDAADFTPILPNDAAWLDKIQHAARVTIDEEGIAAAAYTVMIMAGAARPPEDEVDFILDQPFLFVITSRDNLPLFAGIVNEP